MMFAIPLFSIDLYRDQENSWDYILKNQQELLMMGSSDFSTSSIINLVNYNIQDFVNEDNFIIQYMSPFNEFPYFSNVDLNILRNSDLISST